MSAVAFQVVELGMGSSRFELRVSALAGRVLWPLLFGLIALALAPFWSAARAFMRPCGAPKAVLVPAAGTRAMAAPSPTAKAFEATPECAWHRHRGHD